MQFVLRFNFLFFITCCSVAIPSATLPLSVSKGVEIKSMGVGIIETLFLAI